jgi:hypothetical protein
VVDAKDSVEGQSPRPMQPFVFVVATKMSNCQERTETTSDEHHRERLGLDGSRIYFDGMSASSEFQKYSVDTC